MNFNNFNYSNINQQFSNLNKQLKGINNTIKEEQKGEDSNGEDSFSNLESHRDEGDV